MMLDLPGERAHELEARDKAVRLVQSGKIAGQIDVGNAGAGLGQLPGGVLHERLSRGLDLVPIMRAAEADAGRPRDLADRLRRNPEQNVAIERDVLDGARQDTERVERTGCLHDAVQAVLAIGWAIAGHAAERSGPDGPAGG